MIFKPATCIYIHTWFWKDLLCSRVPISLCFCVFRGGKTFAQSCVNSLEPEDVTVGYVVGTCCGHSCIIHSTLAAYSYNVVTNYAGVVLSKTLSRTEMIYTHGLHLISTVDPQTLEKQVIFSEGIDHNDLNSIAETIIIC